MKKFVLFILGVLSGCLIVIGYFYFYPMNNKGDKVIECKRFVGQLNPISYVDEYSVEFTHTDSDYTFSVSIEPKDSIDFSHYSSNDVLYASLSFDGLIPYSILECDHAFVEIPLVDGKLERFSFSFDKSNHAFQGENLEILNQFLNGESGESIVVSLNLFNPNGIILEVYNSWIYYMGDSV